jgi:hypothetical protein
MNFIAAYCTERVSLMRYASPHFLTACSGQLLNSFVTIHRIIHSPTQAIFSHRCRFLERHTCEEPFQCQVQVPNLGYQAEVATGLSKIMHLHAPCDHKPKIFCCKLSMPGSSCMSISVDLFTRRHRLGMDDRDHHRDGLCDVSASLRRRRNGDHNLPHRMRKLCVVSQVQII